MSKKLSFADLDNFLTTVDDRGSVITKNSFSRVDEYIDTGNYVLNAQFSGSLFGGMPNSRSVLLGGSHGTGKTYLALNICANAQKMGYDVIYCDTEAAIDESTVVKFGLDPNKFRYQPINTPREFTKFTSNLLKKLKEAKENKIELPKIILVLDSIGNMATEKSKDDALAGNNKRDMTKQQDLKSLFAIVTMQLAEYKIPFIASSHTYEEISSFFPSTTISGGCLDGKTLIHTKHGLKKIMDIKENDKILTTLKNGDLPVYEEVSKTWEIEKESYQITLNDGFEFIVSGDHKFLVGDDVNNENDWASVEKLVELTSIKSKNGKYKQIISIKPFGKKVLYDITLPSSHYILQNGLISHNSGAKYNTSIILKLHKAQLQETGNKKAEKVGLKKTGIIVRSVPEKNRFARPITIKFHISFYQGMNRYVGLEEYISWETCGIARGNIETNKKFKKFTDAEKKEFLKDINNWTDGVNGYTFIPKATARKIVVKHLNDSIKPVELFSRKVFTQDVLKQLDETIIKDLFMLPNIGELTEAELLGDITEIKIGEDEIKLDQ